MNKKLIAIAIASVMAAPVAMADLKISGRVGGDLTVFDNDASTDTVTGFTDSGHTRLQFDGTAGNAYARIALDERLSRTGHTHDVDTSGSATDETSTSATTYNAIKRDNYVGYKFGGGMSAQFGRMGGAAKNIEKDPLIGSFLETRSTAANSYTSSKYGSSSFVDHLIQAKFKAGAAKITVQFDVGDNSTYSPNEGHTAIAVTGKGGPVRYWASYNNGTADGNNGSATTSQSNMKLGGEMKFGKATVALNYTSMDKDGSSTSAGNATDSIAVTANIGMGNGLAINAGLAIRSGDVAADDATWMRVAVTKKLNKGTMLYAGVTTTANDTANTDTSEVGAGMVVKF